MPFRGLTPFAGCYLVFGGHAGLFLFVDMKPSFLVLISVCPKLGL